MINVSNDFKTAMKQPVKEIQAFIDYDEGSIRDSDDLISFKVSCDSGLCKAAMRKLEAKYLGSLNLLGKWVKVGYGVRLPDGEFEYLDYGSFLVTEYTTEKDSDTSSVVAYDLMVNAMTPYDKERVTIEYPVSLLTYTRLLCATCGLELGGGLLGGVAQIWGNDSSDSDNMFPLPNALNTIPESISITGNCYQESMTSDIQTIQGTIEIDFIDESATQVKRAAIDLQGYELCSVSGIDDHLGIDINGRVKLAKVIKKIDSYNGEEINTPYISSTGNLETGATVYYASVDPQEIDLGTIALPELFKGTNHITANSNIPLRNFHISYYQAPEVYNPMNDWQITQELWENIEGITYRDIFQQIAQATASTCIIGADDKVYFKPLTDTGEALTYDNMFKLKLEDKYGEINCVVLSRAEIEGENVSMRNEASIETNGITEFKIENNEIIDKDRENAITPIFDVLNGVYYYPFEATTEGLGWYEIGDNITITEKKDDDSTVNYKSSIFNYSITIDGSVKETLKATAETKTQTQHQYTNAVSKQIRNTEIIVNKQDQTIKSIISDMDGVNEKFTSIEQDIENINFNVQNSGGSNLIKNSVMFAYDNEEKPTNWELEGDGTLTIVSDVDFQKNGSISCHGFTLSNKIVRTETIPVKTFNENDPVYYSFSTMIKKGSEGSCYVKIYNPEIGEEYTISLAEGEATTDSNGNITLTSYELSGLKPEGEYFIIEFYGSENSNVTFTDNMLAMGEQKSQWTQANGEVMNTQVNVSLDGVVVRSATYIGDYTIISPLEFAGYSNINGTLTKVFTLNKGVTEVKKLLVGDELTMAPLKVIPVTTGDMQGWAFVPA